MMRRYVYVTADTMATALVKQFPDKCSWLVTDIVACVNSETRANRRTRGSRRIAGLLSFRCSGRDQSFGIDEEFFMIASWIDHITELQ
jgi:hypothetical protein